MDYIINDLIGDDSSATPSNPATPYKTIGKFLSVMSAGDRALLTSNFTLSGALSFPTFTDNTKPSWIVGANASGVVDGTVRTISGAGSVANFGTFSAASYPWNVQCIKLYDFTDYLITSPTATTTVNFFNCIIDTCKGLFSTTYFRNMLLEDCEFVNCSAGTGYVAQVYGGSLKRCKFINCASTTGYIISGSTGGATIIDCIFKGCTTTTGYLIAGGIFLRNVIIDNCSQSTSTTNGFIGILAGGTVRNALITNCAGQNNASSAIIKFIGNSSSNIIDNVAFWNNTLWVAQLVCVATSSYLKTNFPIDLTESPYSDTDLLTLKSTYSWRRNPLKIGEFNNIYSSAV